MLYNPLKVPPGIAAILASVVEKEISQVHILRPDRYYEDNFNRFLAQIRLSTNFLFGLSPFSFKNFDQTQSISATLTWDDVLGAETYDVAYTFDGTDPLTAGVVLVNVHSPLVLTGLPSTPDLAFRVIPRPGTPFSPSVSQALISDRSSPLQVQNMSYAGMVSFFLGVDPNA